MSGLRHSLDIRRSFGAKVLAALLGTVGLLLIVTLFVVRLESNRQADDTVERAVAEAGVLFDVQTELQRQLADRVARPLIEGSRGIGLLAQAIRTDDFDQIADDAEYQLQVTRSDATGLLLAFTDDEAEHVLTILRDERIPDRDIAGVSGLARRLILPDSAEEVLDEITSYRVVGGQLYQVQSYYVEQAGFPLGTTTVGFPVEPDGLPQVRDGFVSCIVVGGECVVSSPGMTPELEALVSASIGLTSVREEVNGAEWALATEHLVETEPEIAMRATAVPLDSALRGYGRIQRALFLSGFGALFLCALLGAAMSRSLTQPIRDLVDAAGRVSEGDYEAEVAVASRDEMGTLGDAFNEMTRGLLERERTRSVLNKVVSQDVAAELMKGDVELGGENREVSVLFADIRGFTPLTEGMEPQEVIRFLNDCMDRLSQAVDAEDGVVDKFIGDELMAVFGAPVARADHAERALNAALRMRAGLIAMNKERAARGEDPLGVGIGIGTGVAVAGNMGSSDRLSYTVLGETVNLAARLTSQARAGEILVTNRTLDAAGRPYEVTPTGERKLKGFSSEIEVFLVDGAPRPEQARAT